eukprot:3629810-Rhodomonas_salina.2
MVERDKWWGRVSAPLAARALCDALLLTRTCAEARSGLLCARGDLPPLMLRPRYPTSATERRCAARRREATLKRR